VSEIVVEDLLGIFYENLEKFEKLEEALIETLKTCLKVTPNIREKLLRKLMR